MGQIVTVCKIDVDGLYVKKVGTFAAGQMLPIDQVPEPLMQKIKNGEKGLNKKGQLIPICSFMTPTGAWISVDESYIPQFNIGTPPPNVEIFESKSEKPRAEKVVVEEVITAEVKVEEVKPENTSAEEFKKKKPKIVKV